MPLDGEKLEELLSGYLDGALTERERVSVEALLGQKDSSGGQARDYLESLQANNGLLGHLSQSSKQDNKLSPDFTSRVMAAIEPVATAVPAKSSSKGRFRIVAVLAAAACLTFVIVNLPQPSNPGDSIAAKGGTSATGDPDAAIAALAAGGSLPEDRQGPRLARDSVAGDGISGDGLAPTDLGGNLPPAEPANQQYVSQLEWAVSMAMILHVRPTDNALQTGVLEQVLIDCGIRTAEPIVASKEVEDALQDSEYIVTDAPQRRSRLYFVRAESKAIDSAFQRIFQDTENFPAAQYNFAIDNPQTRLMEKVARSTGTRFAASDSFAAPVALVEGDTVNGELPRFQAQERLVAKQEREPPMMMTIGSAGDQDISTVLILVELP